MGRTITPWGRECKAQMILNDISLNELSKKTKFSKNYLSAIINGRVAVPDETIKKVSAALGVSLKQTIG